MASAAASLLLASPPGPAAGRLRGAAAAGEAGCGLARVGSPRRRSRPGGRALLPRLSEGVGGGDAPQPRCWDRAWRGGRRPPPPRLGGTLRGRGCGSPAQTHPPRGGSRAQVLPRPPDPGGREGASGPAPPRVPGSGVGAAGGRRVAGGESRRRNWPPAG